MNMKPFATFDTMDEAVAAGRVWLQAVQGMQVDLGSGMFTVNID